LEAIQQLPGSQKPVEELAKHLEECPNCQDAIRKAITKKYDLSDQKIEEEEPEEEEE